MGTGDPTTLPAGWTFDERNGADVSITDERAYSGQTSLKVVSNGAGYNRGFLTFDLATVAPGLRGNLFGRMMVYLSDTNSNQGDLTFLQAEGSTPKPESGAPAGTEVMYRGRIDATHDHVFTNYDTQVDTDSDGVKDDWPTDCYQQPTFDASTPPESIYLFPKNQWVCVIWHVEQLTDHVAVHLNGHELSQIRVFDTGDGCANEVTQAGVWYAPQQFDRLNVGIEQYDAAAQPRTLYIDDVAMNDTRLSCP